MRYGDGVKSIVQQLLDKHEGDPMARANAYSLLAIAGELAAIELVLRVQRDQRTANEVRNSFQPHQLAHVHGTLDAASRELGTAPAPVSEQRLTVLAAQLTMAARMMRNVLVGAGVLQFEETPPGPITPSK